MGQFGGFYKGENRKMKKKILEKKAKNETFKQTFVLPAVSIIKKGKNEAE
jgi:hypothetical protein